MARDFTPIFEALAGRPPGLFSNGDFARMAGISPPRASTVLRRFLETGFLVRVGEGRQSRYARATSSAHRPFPSLSFWSRLSEARQDFAYVLLLRFGRAFRTRAQAREVLATCPFKTFTVVDFEGVTGAGEPFLETLFYAPSGPWLQSVQPIHVAPTIRSALARLSWRRDLAHGNTRELSASDPSVER